MSQPQHMEALQLANEIRLQHVAIRKQIKAGEVTFQQAIGLPYGDRMPITKLFGAYRHTGPRLASLICRAANVREDRAWRDLTDRQQRILTEIGEWWDDGHRTLPWHYNEWRVGA
jgi:hypothetical protein